MDNKNFEKQLAEIREMAEAIKKKSYDEGFKAGHKKGYEKGREESAELISELMEENEHLRLELNLGADDEELCADEFLDEVIGVAQEFLDALHRIKDAEVD